MLIMSRERLRFGNVPKEESSRRKRQATLRHKKLEKKMGLEKPGAFDNLRLTPLIRIALQEESRKWVNSTYKEDTLGMLKGRWGNETELVRYFSPSTLSLCLRWVGYQALGEYVPEERKPETEIILGLGQSGHYFIERVLRRFGVSEMPVWNDEERMRGRLDFLIKNPAIDEYQILDFKFVSSFAFKKIKREGLPDYLRETKGIYNPGLEAKLQTQLYIWMKRENGLDVTMGNVIYINRDNGQMKECLVPWDAVAEEEVRRFLGKLDKARERIEMGELPEPSVQSKYVCEYLCPYSKYCEYGQKFKAGQVRRRSKKLPPGILTKAREQAKKRKEMMEKMGIAQLSMELIEK